ncbi:MAG: hypothetical protein ACLFP1_08595 [Candidatus Goldiibacteriota bacterium]
MDSAEAPEQEADEAVILEIPDDFYAVSRVYGNFYNINDKEVLGYLKSFSKKSGRRT